jgi:hypothetical protein
MRKESSDVFIAIANSNSKHDIVITNYSIGEISTMWFSNQIYIYIYLNAKNSKYETQNIKCTTNYIYVYKQYMYDANFWNHLYF